MMNFCDDIDCLDDKLHDECGVVGIFLNKKNDNPEKKEYKAYSAKDFNAATQAYYALYALQHRGQESAGIAISDGKEMKLHKGKGTTAEVFNQENLLALTGHIACAHVRYATAGNKSPENAQPMM
ncbi:MAG: amidophosphoribosyltransferase, partial [Spirochaetia bacterium]|nr:amidophosphoribosyltransferase [Spirochaetia bacterium]